MRNYDPARISVAFAQLFRTYPSFQASTDEDADETLRVYFEAVEPYRTEDIEAAVRNFVTGTVPGANPAFAPPAPQVAAECRRVMNLRLDSERRIRRPALPPPDIERPPEARERVKALMQSALDELAGADLTPADAERTKRAKERAEAETRWLRDRGDLVEVRGVSHPVSSSLLQQYYSVGDEDGDRDVA